MATTINIRRRTQLKNLPRSVTGVTGTTTIPKSTQTFPILRTKSTYSDGESLRFVFPFPPNNIRYGNLSPEWSEVSRPGKVPFVGLSQFKLMRVEFDFLISAPYDGILYSVETELEAIREIAASTNPIYFLNMDRMIVNPFKLPGSQRTENSSMFFRCVDFSVESVRRNTSNQITAATCSIALQEDYAYQFVAVQMPEIEYPTIMKPRVPPPPPKDKNEDTRCTITQQQNNLCFGDTIPNTIRIAENWGRWD